LLSRGIEIETERKRERERERERERSRESFSSRGELEQFASIKVKKNGARRSSLVIAPINDDRGRERRVPRTGRAEDSRRLLRRARSFLSGDIRDSIPAGQFAEYPDAVIPMLLFATERERRLG
jgi:hypothetical protein